MQSFWESVRRFLRNLDIVLPEDPDISSGHVPKDALIYNMDMCSTMFIAVFFIIARSWKEFTFTSTKEWIQKMCIFTQWISTQLLKK